MWETLSHRKTLCEIPNTPNLEYRTKYISCIIMYFSLGFSEMSRVYSTILLKIPHAFNNQVPVWTFWACCPTEAHVIDCTPTLAHSHSWKFTTPAEVPSFGCNGLDGGEVCAYFDYWCLRNIQTLREICLHLSHDISIMALIRVTMDDAFHHQNATMMTIDNNAAD